MLISRRSDEDAIIRDARAEIVRLRGEVDERISPDWVIGYFPADVAEEVKRAVRDAFGEWNALSPKPAPAMPNGAEGLVAALRDLRLGVEMDADYVDNATVKLAALDWAIAALRAADNHDAVGVDSEEDAYVIERMGKLLAEIAVIVNGPEPDMTRWSYHDLPEKVRALKTAPAPVPAGEAVAYSVVQVGNRGAAYDPPNTHRAFTYEHQPGNIDASRLGRATNAAAAASAGDSIDRGLSLLKELQAIGFGVFQIGPPAPVQAAPQEAEDAAIAAAFREVGACSYAQDSVAGELFAAVRKRAALAAHHSACELGAVRELLSRWFRLANDETLSVAERTNYLGFAGMLQSALAQPQEADRG